MHWAKFLGFIAGVLLAASPTVLAQTGPTYPTTPSATIAGPSGDNAVGSGSSTDPSNPVDPEKQTTRNPDGLKIILPGTDPAAGR
jgi:hypothetical protein